MNIDSIKKIELEITSDCNAACPGCARTLNVGKYEVTGFSLEDLKRIFPSQRHIKDKMFKFCGVLGDPIVNPDCLDMVKYLADNGGQAHLSTNAGYNNVAWWTELGEISKNNSAVQCFFAIDGHKETNHIYRVNTKWSVIERNIEAYSLAGGKGSWIYIVFDHNEHELDIARQHAEKLGYKFATRTGMRNSFHQWVSKTKKKDTETKKIVEEKKIITTTGKKEHTKAKEVKEIANKLKYAERGLIEKNEIKEIMDTITCKLIHQGEIFISSKQTMWPCCFLFDSTVWNKDDINSKLAEYGDTWNSLKSHSIDDVLQHQYFANVLQDSWNIQHPKYMRRCARTCAHKQAYHNEMHWEKKNVVK